MSDLQRGSGRRPSRAQRSQRAFQLVVASGVLGLATVVTFILAIVGAASFGLFVLLLILTAVAVYFTRRSVS